MRLTAVAAVLTTCLCAAGAAQAAELTRQLPAFIAINAKGAFVMTVEVGPAQSVRISGDDKFVSTLKAEVVDRELQLLLPEKSYSGTLKDPRITITVPSLSRVKVEGAGETVLNKINSERIDISYLGAGRLAANGQVKYLRLNAKGVGEVDASKLRSERVDVNFEGLGNVSVHATTLLNAVAKGIGNLTYYGRPATVNKSVSGIGNVRAGD